MPSFNPNQGTKDLPSSSLQRIIDQGFGEAYETGIFNLTEQFLAAVKASTDVNEQVWAFAQAMDQLNHSSKSQLTNIHEQVGRLMQRATLAAFDKAMAEHGRNLPAYRTKTRYAGGALRRALASKAFVRSAYNGIGFANVALLDHDAKQWHRLNFGAGQAGKYTPTMYEVRFGNLVAGAFGFADEEPSKAFMMPKGFFGTGGKAGMFFPTGRDMVKKTRGITSWNFLDAGPKVLAREIGPYYETLYRDWFASSQRGKGPLSRVARVPSPRKASFYPS